MLWTIRFRNPRGFTLVELLVVIGIIGVLIASGTTVHRHGINLLYADQSAHQLPLGQITDTTNYAYYQSICAGQSAPATATEQSLWTSALDPQH
jgi:prepilin-type N-terminal cleavage/methylation domain-containing protein